MGHRDAVNSPHTRICAKSGVCATAHGASSRIKGVDNDGLRESPHGAHRDPTGLAWLAHALHGPLLQPAACSSLSVDVKLLHLCQHCLACSAVQYHVCHMQEGLGCRLEGSRKLHKITRVSSTE